jgi:DNA-binding transcriptional regulator YhcF (GntR family)
MSKTISKQLQDLGFKPKGLVRYERRKQVAISKREQEKREQEKEERYG